MKIGTDLAYLLAYFRGEDFTLSKFFADYNLFTEFLEMTSRLLIVFIAYKNFFLIKYQHRAEGCSMSKRASLYIP